jgi:hypothetical protein
VVLRALQRAYKPVTAEEGYPIAIEVLALARPYRMPSLPIVLSVAGVAGPDE